MVRRVGLKARSGCGVSAEVLARHIVYPLRRHLPIKLGVELRDPLHLGDAKRLCIAATVREHVGIKRWGAGVPAPVQG